MKATKIILAALSVTMLFSSFSFAQTAKKKKIKIVIPILDEMAGSQFPKTLQEVAGVVGKETGFEAEVEIRPYTRGTKTYEFMKKAFTDGGADYSVLFAEDYARLVKLDDKNPLVRPLVILTMDQKKSSTVCFFVKKDSDYKSVTDLKGKRAGASTAGYIRYALHEKANFDESLFNYFSDVSFISDISMTDIIISLVNGEIDAFTTSLSGYKMSSKPPEAKDVKPIDCLEYSGNLMIVARYDIPVEEAAMVRTLFLKAHKSETFAKFHFLFKAINGNFVPVTEDDLATTRKIVALNKKYNWEADDDRLAALNKK